MISATVSGGAYDANQIKVLKGLEAVRKRPGMYIGDTGKTGFHHMLWEIVDNSIDEHMAGYCQNIHIVVHADGSASVRDDGRGIPVAMHKEEKMSSATVVMTVLHAGGKFDNGDGQSAYKTTGGLHGVGASVVNALSSRFEMVIWRDGGEYAQEFESGGKPVRALRRVKDSTDHGTWIRFWPDSSIFLPEEGEPPLAFDRAVIERSLSSRAHLNPGLTITLEDQRSEPPSQGRWQATSFADILDVLLPGSSAGDLSLPTLMASERVPTKAGDVDVMLALRVTARRDCVVGTYANNIITPQGGTHEAGFRASLLRAFNRYAEENKLLKEPLVAEDVREGLVAAVAVRLTEPRFAGQTKDKLANTECNGAVATVTYALLSKWFEEHPREARLAIARAERAARARAAADRARDLVERKTPLSIGALPGKLADCQENDPSKCELYIVEGDSAGGSAKQGRDRKFQAILPLKGKPLNTWKVDDDGKSLKSEEIQNILTALGCGVGATFDLSKLRYHKLIFMTDADVDGAHITTLLLTLLHRYTPELISAGHVYVAMPPLYRVRKGKGESTWLRDDAALTAYFAGRSRDGWDISRFKGLGEMNPEQLWQTTMNPQSRQLTQVTYGDPQNPANESPVFDLLMGREVPPRKAFIEDRAGYATVDV